MSKHTSTVLLGEYNVGSEIGKGSFANVYKGIHIPSKKAVAIKAVQMGKLNKKLALNLESEVQILKTIQHPHIVQLIDYHKTSSTVFIVMEYCSLGDLSYFFLRRKEIIKSLPLIASMFNRYPSVFGNGLHPDLVRHFLQQLASALMFLRERNLIHRDIKPQNLLLCPPSLSQQEAKEAGYKGLWNLPVLKLADFGFARMLPSASLAETLCGSPLYMAPEILRHERYGAKADLWSVGAVLYQLATGVPPFGANNHIELLSQIERTNDQIKFPSGTTVDPDIKRMIRTLLKKNPTERMSFTEFFNDPLMLEEIESEEQPLDQTDYNENLYISEYITTTGTRDMRTKRPHGTTCKPNFMTQNGIDRHQNCIASNQTLHHQQHQQQTSCKPIAEKRDTADNNDGYSLQGFASSSPSSSWLAQTDKGHKGAQRSISVPTPQSISPSAGFAKATDSDYVVVEKRAVEINTLADNFVPEKTAGSSRRASSRSGGIRGSSGSRERRGSISYGSSPSNALTRALSMASARLFGTSADDMGQNSPPQFASQRINLIDSEERKIIKTMDDLAIKAKVIGIFAQVKYSQLTSTVSEEGIDIGDTLPEDTLMIIAQEAVVLLVTTLSLLSKAMKQASIWWKSNTSSTVSNKLSDTVQWIRENFNESLEKAQYAQNVIRKCSNAGNRPAAVSAEKLIFDRAMELSKIAATNEKELEDLDGCQLSYGTAIWMLEALLEQPDDDDDDNENSGLDKDDINMVIGLIDSLNHRLSSVRKKIEELR
jgi:serine/threonine-protein kinase ULK/ATG1